MHRHSVCPEQLFTLQRHKYQHSDQISKSLIWSEERTKDDIPQINNSMHKLTFVNQTGDNKDRSRNPGEEQRNSPCP